MNRTLGTQNNKVCSSNYFCLYWILKCCCCFFFYFEFRVSNWWYFTRIRFDVLQMVNWNERPNEHSVIATNELFSLLFCTASVCCVHTDACVEWEMFVLEAFASLSCRIPFGEILSLVLHALSPYLSLSYLMAQKRDHLVRWAFSAHINATGRRVRTFSFAWIDFLNERIDVFVHDSVAKLWNNCWE